MAISRLRPSHRKSIMCLSFCDGEDLLVSVGSDEFNSITLWDWKSASKVAHVFGSKEKQRGQIDFVAYDRESLKLSGASEQLSTVINHDSINALTPFLLLADFLGILLAAKFILRDMRGSTSQGLEDGESRREHFEVVDQTKDDRNPTGAANLQTGGEKGKPCGHVSSLALLSAHTFRSSCWNLSWRDPRVGGCRSASSACGCGTSWSRPGADEMPRCESRWRGEKRKERRERREESGAGSQVEVLLLHLPVRAGCRRASAGREHDASQSKTRGNETWPRHFIACSSLPVIESTGESSGASQHRKLLCSRTRDGVGGQVVCLDAFQDDEQQMRFVTLSDRGIVKTWKEGDLKGKQLLSCHTKRKATSVACCQVSSPSSVLLLAVSFEDASIVFLDLRSNTILADLRVMNM
eukprot:762531-Hanusia_phi.AAC.1